MYCTEVLVLCCIAKHLESNNLNIHKAMNTTDSTSIENYSSEIRLSLEDPCGMSIQAQIDNLVRENVGGFLFATSPRDPGHMGGRLAECMIGLIPSLLCMRAALLAVTRRNRRQEVDVQAEPPQAPRSSNTAAYATQRAALCDQICIIEPPAYHHCVR